MTENDNDQFDGGYPTYSRHADPRVAALAGRYGAAVMIGDGNVVLTVVGEIDLATVTRFRAAIEDAVDSVLAVGASALVLDVTGVRFLDAAGVGALAAAAERLRVWGARMTLHGVSPRLSWLFDVTNDTRGLGIDPAVADSPIVSALTVAASIPVRAVLDSALQLVVTMAHAVVAGADGVSITLPRGGGLGTVAASNDVVMAMDKDQYTTGEGPCLDAATQGKRFHIGTLARETRWPAFVPLARARGIETILSTPLVHADQPIGALNIYSRTAEAFAANEQSWADQFAAEAAVVVSAARHAADVDDDGLGQRLQRALVARDDFTRAQGLVMQRDRIGADAAAFLLRRVSREADQSLRETCEALLIAAARTAQSAARSEATADDRVTE